MFNNIGGKIKGLTKLICWICIAACVIIGLVVMLSEDEYIVLGLAIMVVGALLSWVGSFLLCGYGELIYRVTRIDKVLNGGGKDGSADDEGSGVASNAKETKLNELKRLRDNGVITDEEYDETIKKL